MLRRQLEITLYFSKDSGACGIYDEGGEEREREKCRGERVYC